MKIKETKELKNKSKEELKTLLEQIKEELFNLVLSHNLRKLKNTRLIFNKRKDMARILTTLHGKELSNEETRR